VQELGIIDPDQVKLWADLPNSVQAVSMAFMAPIWGALADRHGRTMMVERAMFGGALIFLAMGFARDIHILRLLRILQGMITGTVPAATALVASTTPRGNSGQSMGTLHTGIWLGA
jgi:DHA1 family multidrug resistance protein-like MFS transporter